MFSCFRGEGEDTGPRQLKTVILGDYGCGRTSLLYRFAYDEFPTGYIPTAFGVGTKTVHYKQQEVQLAMYDTAGGEDYHRLRPLTYDQTDVMVICFSLDDPNSLNNVLLNWLPEVRHFCGNIPILLVGNKKDLRHHASENDTAVVHPDLDETSLEKLKQRPEKNTVSFDEGQAVATKMGAVGYFETSAKTREGVDTVFEGVVRVGMEAEVKKSRGLFGWKKK